MSRDIRVLVADDSPLVRELLAGVLAEKPGFRLVGTASNGDEAAEMTAKLRPDVITMDLQMPGSDGFAGIARIMADTPTPILVLSVNREEVRSFRALSLGALDLMEKPDPSSYGAFAEDLTRRLRLLATVPVIRHPRGRKVSGPPVAWQGRARLVVIGASLGGPKAVASILRSIPPSFPAPILLVQHIANGFTGSFARWLRQETRLQVREAEDGDPLVAGTVFVAPSDRHLIAERSAVHLDDAPPENGFRPSVSRLFASAARSHGDRVCAVLLTGMGKDGADGMAALRGVGAMTIAQDEATSAVFGMPRAAIELDAVRQVLPLARIPEALELAVS